MENRNVERNEGRGHAVKIDRGSGTPVSFCLEPVLSINPLPQLHTLSVSLWGLRDSRLQLNFRATQPLNGRTIEASFPAVADSSPEPGAQLSHSPCCHNPAMGPTSSCVFLCTSLSQVLMGPGSKDFFYLFSSCEFLPLCW